MEYKPHELRNKKNNHVTDDNRLIVKLPWIPRVTQKLKKSYRKKGFKVVCSSSPNLQTILCKNKDKLPPNSDPGVYRLDCTCGKSYVGESKKKILTRSLEHQKDVLDGNWSKSGVTEHTRVCHGRFNWINPTTLQKEPRYHHRKIS